jgi:hypothetical protein
LSTVKTKTLFTTVDDKWSVIHETWDLTAEGSVCAFHVGCPDYEDVMGRVQQRTRDASWFIGEDPQCWSCKGHVPDEIQTIYKLYEYGRDELHKYPGRTEKVRWRS